MTRQCKKCGEVKPLEAFRVEKRMWTCRKCESARAMAHMRKSPEHRMKAIEACRRYHENRPEKYRKRDHKAEYQKHKQRKLVRAETKRLIGRGEIEQQTWCAVCGASDPEVHHLSYDRADHIIWLCRPCHTRQHRLTPEQVAERHDAAIRALKTQRDEGE